MQQVYMDHAATTPLDERVLEAMLPYLKEHFGNASSVHARGRKARFAVEASRERIAGLIGAEPGEIVFTSGGTEADNLALKGVLQQRQQQQGARGHLITSAAEHEAVLRPAEALSDAGWPVTILDPGPHGAVTPHQVTEAFRPDTVLVSLMHANNETGVLTPIEEIAAVCRKHDVLLHCDAVQTAGLLPLNVNDLGVDLLSMSGHKFYGPKGIGALYVRGGVDLDPLVEGGSQERKRRGGTENVAAVVGCAEALALAVDEAAARAERIRCLQRRLTHGLQDRLGNAMQLNTPLDDAPVAPHIVNLSFPPHEEQPMDGEMLLLNLDMQGVHASAGSACTSGALEPSHVLSALGLPRATASAAARFSLGKDTTEEEVDYVIETLETVVQRMRR
ncbi:MAG: aminotransferase class V-fold PLP-dependent enzyme [Bacteroidetes bacterium]|jgi:cysteine desulfurase|nr:aminotransferase class V-fold PLP-dependent enzyme [Bacteroidota bacterium]